MSSVSDKLVKFLERALQKAFSNESSKDDSAVGFEKRCSFSYETVEEYKEAGHHFRRTKDQMSRGLTRKEAFEEFKKEKKSF